MNAVLLLAALVMLPSAQAHVDDVTSIDSMFSTSQSPPTRDENVHVAPGPAINDYTQTMAGQSPGLPTADPLPGPQPRPGVPVPRSPGPVPTPGGTSPTPGGTAPTPPDPSGAPGSPGGPDPLQPPPWVCFARNLRGQQFQAIGPDPQHTQKEAMQLCQQHSLVCSEQGCKRL